MSDNSDLYNCYKYKPATKVRIKRQPDTGHYTVKFNGQEIDECRQKLMSKKVAYVFRNMAKYMPKYKGFSNYLKVVPA